MSFRAVVWAFGVQDLLPSAKLTLLTLASLSGHREAVTISGCELAGLVGVSERTIITVIASLRRRGLIQTAPQFARSGARSPDLISIMVGADR